MPVPLCRYVLPGEHSPHFGLIVGDRVIDLEAAGGPPTLHDALTMSAKELFTALREATVQATGGVDIGDVELLAPLDEQEVWAAGVTYLRSRDARMEESTQKDVYDQVYDADRPELFFKATPSRVAHPGKPVAIRGDSTWDVPEPELTVVINAGGEIVGYTVGNDVSSRSIEGENPLYLPQAKFYTHSAALGPTIATSEELPDAGSLGIDLTIKRGGKILFQDHTSTANMHRTLDDLVSYLKHSNTFPAGAMLMTGTGLVPPSEFTLEDGDEVTISIEGIGTLVNPVVRLPA